MMEFQPNQSKNSDYQMKKYEGNAEDFNTQKVQYELELQQTQKANLLKKRLEAFIDIKTLEEARELAQKIIPISQEKNSFKVGNARCVVINKPDMLRISIDTPTEFISYDFV